MRKVAVIFESSPFDRKGLFNAVHNRILNLKTIGEFEIDAFCIHSWDTAFTRKIRHNIKIDDRCPLYMLDGIQYKMLWYDFSIVDHILLEKLYLRPVFYSCFMNKIKDLFSDYEMILAHSFTGGIIALEVFKSFGIPYMVTWHGSDIHTHPWRNPRIFKDTCQVMKNASYNCFVSHALCSESDKLLKYVRKEILYNGVSDSFKKLSDSDRIILREKYGVLPEEKLIAFVGNLINVKNVMSLRPIFHEVRAKYQGKLKFWLVGDGKLRSAVQQAMDADDTIDVFFWGNVPAEQMPDIMNCIDVLTLPSINEGLALVCAEAIRCGAAVVGSSVGGIPEVIGHEYSVPLDEGFVGNISDKIVEILLKGAKQNIPEHMDWKITAGAEMKLIESVLSGMC